MSFIGDAGITQVENMWKTTYAPSIEAVYNVRIDGVVFCGRLIEFTKSLSLIMVHLSNGLILYTCPSPEIFMQISHDNTAVVIINSWVEMSVGKGSLYSDWGEYIDSTDMTFILGNIPKTFINRKET